MALEILDDLEDRGPLRSSVRGELAATLATKARALISEATQGDYQPLYRQIREELRLLYSQEPANYYPLDILAWSMRDYLQRGNAPISERVEIQADLLGAFETATISLFDSGQRERFNTRRMQLGDVLNIRELSDDAFADLEAAGSKAGYLVRAYTLAGELPQTETIGPEPLRRCDAALNYLEQNWAKIKSDSRCLRLKLQLWWLVHTRRTLLSGDRQTLPFSDQQWAECLRILSSLLATPEYAEDPMIQFLYAIGLFHQRDFERAQAVFRHIDVVAGHALGRRRVIRSYVASDQHGNSLEYHGTVATLSRDGRRGEVYVEEIRRRVHFLPRDFNRPEIEPQ